jgi:glucokinase
MLLAMQLEYSISIAPRAYEALATFLNLFDPEVIAIGGGLSEAGDLVLEPARRELRLRSTSPSRDLVEIRKATLGARSGMLGAAALARGENGEYVLTN